MNFLPWSVLLFFLAKITIETIEKGDFAALKAKINFIVFYGSK